MNAGATRRRRGRGDLSGRRRPSGRLLLDLDSRVPRTLSLAVALALAVTTFAPRLSRCSTDGVTAGAPALSPGARSQIEKRLREARFDPARFALEPLGGWPQERLRLVAARPMKDKVAQAPIFAVLPDDAVVMAGDPDGFRKLVAKAFPAPQPSDAAAVAQLAVWFGAYGQPVGVLVSSLPATRESTKVPRADPRPVMTRRDGVVTVDHYSYDYDRQRLFDCHLELGPAGGAKGSCAEVR